MKNKTLTILIKETGKEIIIKMNPLTEKQMDCEIFMDSFKSFFGRKPTVRETAQALSISPTAAYHRMKKVKEAYEKHPSL